METEVRNLVRQAFVRREPHLFAGLFLTSMAVLSLELLLTRVFSVTMWYHFAFMAVSVALLGLAAGAVAVFLGLGRAARPERTLPLYSGLGAASIVVTLCVVTSVRFEPRMTLSNLLRLAGLYAVCSLPFFWGGACTATMVKRFAARMGVVYLFDLAGAGLGCLAVLVVLTPLGGPGSVALVAVLFASAAVTFAQTKRVNVRLYVIPLLGLAAVWVANRQGFLELRYAKERREEGLLLEAWNAYSRLAVYPIERQGTRFFSWGMSPYYDGPTPPQLALDIDAYASTPITNFKGNYEEVEYVRHDVTAVAYYLRPGGECVIIGAGGGRDILTALALGQQRVVAVEMNPLVVHAVNDVFGEFSGRPYSLPGVLAVVDEARSYLRRVGSEFDIIQASLVDTWAATSAGAYALAENGVYTVEAAEEFLGRLKPDGLLSFSRFIFDPPRQTLRLVGVFAEALRRGGAEAPEEHIAVLRRGRIGTTVARRSPFPREEIRRLREIAVAMGFEEVLMPDRPQKGPFWQVACLGADAPFIDDYFFDVSPTTDDRPFFFHMIRPQQFLEVFRLDDLGGQTHNYDAVVILVALLAISATAVALVVVVPLLVRGGRVGKGGWFLVYFIVIGLAFMLVEIALIQKYVLYLGHPIYSLAVVLFSLLVAGAAGSLLSQRVSTSFLAVGGSVAALALSGALAAFLLVHPDLFAATQGLSKGWRIALSVSTVIPFGLLMGVPLPVGVRLVESRGASLVPWAWGLNSASSVTGAVLAFVVALNFGFIKAIALGAGLYVVASALLVVRSRRSLWG